MNPPEIGHRHLGTVRGRFQPLDEAQEVLRHFVAFKADAGEELGALAVFDHRRSRYNLLVIGAWDRPAEDEANRIWTRDTWAVMQPFASEGVYVNDLGTEADEGGNRLAAVPAGLAPLWSMTPAPRFSSVPLALRYGNSRTGGVLAMERRLSAIFVADMVGYSRLMEDDEAKAISLVRELRERALEPEIAARGGEILKRMGDGWIASFDSAQSAVDTAMAVQTALKGDPKIRLRLAVHIGEVSRDEVDVYGNGINIAARLLTEAAPGGVMISRDLLRQLDQRMAGLFADAGTFRLKNLAQPVSAWQWRPGQVARSKDGQRDDIPVIAVERITMPADQTLREAGADLSEQLVHLLSRRSGVRVVALDGGPTAETRATHVLRGRLRVRQASVTLTLTLLLCQDRSVIWSRSYEGDTDTVFDLCDRAAVQAASELRLQINAYDGKRLEGLGDDELSPAQLRTRAAELMYRTTTADQRHAVQLLERALELDRSNPTSLAMWAEARFFLGAARFERPSEETSRALMAAVDQAVQLAPRSDYVFYVRSHLRARLSGDIVGARRDLGRMERINPGNVLRFEAEGVTELAAGAWPAAIEAFSRAVSMSEGDPYLPLRLYCAAIARLLEGEPEAAARSIAEAIELRSNTRPYWLLLAKARDACGDRSGAQAAEHEAARLPGDPDILAPELPLPGAATALMAGFVPAKM